MYDTVKNICPNCFSSPETGTCRKCGCSLTEETSYALSCGTILSDRYIIGKILGVGGYGITYKAMDIVKNKVCAIKEYYPSEIAMRNADTLAVYAVNKKVQHAYNTGLQRFFIEIQVLSLMNNCDGIVDVTSYIKANNTAYMVMDFLKGVTLRKMLSRKKMSNEYKLDILMSVLKALKNVHEKGLLHRDISPENIFITNDNKVVLIDFGAARYFVGKATRGLSVILKPGFAPPEQYSTKGNQGPWTDMYAIAATYYYMMTGKMIPDSLQRLNGTQVLPLKNVCSNVPLHISEAIEKALDIEPSRRFTDVNEFLNALSKEQETEQKTSSIFINILNRLSSLVKELKGRITWSSIKKNVSIKNSWNWAPYLLLMQGNQKYRFSLQLDTPLQIGSAESCDIVIISSEISRVHCTVYYDSSKKGFMLIDSSKNGTFSINGRRYQSNITHKIKKNDRFYLSSQNYIIKVGIERTWI